jgi:hypothetical protein
MLRQRLSTEKKKKKIFWLITSLVFTVVFHLLAQSHHLRPWAVLRISQKSFIKFYLIFLNFIGKIFLRILKCYGSRNNYYYYYYYNIACSQKGFSAGNYKSFICYKQYIYTHKHTYIHTYTHTYIHTYIHTHIHTHIHTYIHTYKQTQIKIL